LWNKPRGSIRLLMTPGPVEVSPRVLQAMSRPQIYHYYENFVDFFAETVEKMKKVYQTKNDVLILQGEGVLGLEAAVMNTINPGDKVLVLDSGPFGKWFSFYVENAEGKPVMLSCDNNDAIDPKKLKEKLDVEKDIKAMTVVHCETPSGTLNPIKELCPIAKEKGILTIVDSVASLGGVNVRPDEWGIDICCGASQKAISAPPGLTMMSMSRDAWKAVEQKRKPIKNSYISLIDYRDTWVKDKRFPFTPFVSEMYGLAEATDELLEEGLQNSFKRHAIVAEECRKGLERLGVKLWPKRREICSNTVTAFEIPTSYTDPQIVGTMAEKYGVLIGGGFRETKGRLLRIGHMGYQASLTNILTTLAAMERTLNDLRKS
jgi:aspartate aminotransferase-like enzyme